MISSAKTTENVAGKPRCRKVINSPTPKKLSCGVMLQTLPEAASVYLQLKDGHSD